MEPPNNGQVGARGFVCYIFGGVFYWEGPLLKESVIKGSTVYIIYIRYYIEHNAALYIYIERGKLLRTVMYHCILMVLL